jgi:2-phospho-L-lactate guanylyltransferase
MKDLITIIPVSNLNESKTRLSPFLTKEERVELLKVMIKDIVQIIRDEVEEIILVSNDENVKDYAKELNVSFILEKEHKEDRLNNALSDAIQEVKMYFDDKDILILPSDIPLIKKEHIITVKQMDKDLIISPSKGGGTNLLCLNSDYDFKTCFGDMSFFKHLNTANNLNMSINLIESFYISIDMNTPEDLGELILHGTGTYSYDLMKKMKIDVKCKHGPERLYVERKN